MSGAVGPVYVPSGLPALCWLSQSIVCPCPSAARQHTFFRCFSYFRSWPCKVGLSAWLKAAGSCPFRQSLMVIFIRPLWAGLTARLIREVLGCTLWRPKLPCVHFPFSRYILAAGIGKLSATSLIVIATDVHRG